MTPGRWQVHFEVGADDSYYYADVWIHCLTAEEAQSLVRLINMVGDVGLIQFGPATMMGDSRVSTKPDLGWHQHTKEDGTEVRSKDRTYHFYINR